MASNKAIIDTLIAEAVGEGDEGLTAVAYTILNRAREDGKTPQQIVNSGAYTGRSSPGSGAKKSQSDPAIRARVQEIWNNVSAGKVPDPTGGATHYWAPKGMPGKKDPYWADEEASPAGRLKIGNHVFLPKTTPNSALAAIEQASPTIPPRRPDSLSAFAPEGRTGSFNTEIRYAPGAGRGASGTLNASPIRVAGGVQGIAGARSDASGSASLAPSWKRDFLKDFEAIQAFRDPIRAFIDQTSGKTQEYLDYSKWEADIANRGNRQIASAAGGGLPTIRPTVPTASSGLTPRPVRTIPIAPGNSRVPTTNLEQLQLGLEQRIAQNNSRAVLTASAGLGVARNGAGSVSLQPRTASLTPVAPSNAPGQTWGVGGANQAGTNRMAASEPSIMQTIRPQLQAAQAALDAKPSAVATARPIVGAQGAASQSLNYASPLTPKVSAAPTQAQMQAIRQSTFAQPSAVPNQTKITPKQINQNTPFNVPQPLGYQPVVKAYADRLTPAQQAIDLVSPAKTPLEITVRGGKTTTGPFLPMSADAGARARANALIAANPKPIAPAPMQRPINRVSAPLTRTPVVQQVARPVLPKSGGLLGLLSGAIRPVAAAPVVSQYQSNGVANPAYRDYSPTYTSEGGGVMPSGAYSGGFTDSLGGTYYTRNL